MALRQCVCCFTVMFILWCKGCHSQQPACVKTVKNSTIVGGLDPSWPWKATLFINNSLYGGSLITEQWVLTAASFITLSDRPNTVVYLGLHNMLKPNAVRQTVESIICHPDYNSSTHENDICLLKLSAPVNFTDYIQPICLASENSTFYNGASSWITGFGGGSFPSFLQEVNVSIVGANECKCQYKNLTEITENMICAGLRAGGKSSCYRDLGGPLISNKDSIRVQSGVANVGAAGFFDPVRPGVYTRVSWYQKWIAATVTGTPPGFVNFTSPGPDSLNFTCSKSSPTSPPITVNATVVNSTANATVVNSTVPTTTVHTTVHSGENLIHFTHFASLCVFVLLIHIFTANGM